MTAGREFAVLSDPALLEKVDRLRDLNIGQHVPLPQLVVVGDQSSGKSSLLESLTGIPFPRDQSLCTRHATQITSRRSDDERVEISIIPGPSASEEHKKDVEAFHRRIRSGSEFRRLFVDILKKANEMMGLRADLSMDSGAVFSDDVLKVEVQGPNEDYLTIIDVPGIFRTTTQGTTKDDITMVKDLVTRYIKDDRTIILAVLPSNVDVATQEILELAKDYDKNGERTLGVLTKPDLVIESNAQAAVCDLIQGKKRPLTLGYFLVRNRGANDGLQEQPELDQIFRQQPWSELPRERTGISALKEQLRSLLVEITRREFPKLLLDVSNQIKECKRELDCMGPPRQDEREQRSFLSRIAGTFQDRVRAALAADYIPDPVFDQDDLRLITHVVNITDVYSADFRQRAHSRHFQEGDPPSSVMAFETDSEGYAEETPAESTIDKLRALLEKAKVDDIASRELSELGDLVTIPSPHKIAMPHYDFSTWINDIYLQSRGLDLGTFNSSLVSTAFIEQSRKWGDLTQIYMSRIVIILHRFIAATLRSICSEEQIRSRLWSAIVDSLVERYKEAMTQARRLIDVEQRRKPYTLNQQFAEAVSKSRGYRVTEILRPKARKDTKQFGGTQYMVNLDDIAKAVEGKSNVEHVQEAVHDILRAYYNIALDRFIDNVFHLAVDDCLLHGPFTPLNVFTQEWVINLESEQLERLVGETKFAKRCRTKLAKNIQDLSDALKILRS